MKAIPSAANGAALIWLLLLPWLSLAVWHGSLSCNQTAKFNSVNAAAFKGFFLTSSKTWIFFGKLHFFKTVKFILWWLGHRGHHHLTLNWHMSQPGTFWARKERKIGGLQYLCVTKDWKALNIEDFLHFADHLFSGVALMPPASYLCNLAPEKMIPHSSGLTQTSEANCKVKTKTWLKWQAETARGVHRLSPKSFL